MPVAIQVVNHHRGYKLDTSLFETVGTVAATHHPPRDPGLELIEVAFVDDREIARVHGDFLDDPAPTDVITFDHGEIVISVDTAERQRREAGESLERELALYLVHGLLHLAGYDDKSDEDFATMKDEQERILRLAWEGAGK